jgi:hypothetical protein
MTFPVDAEIRRAAPAFNSALSRFLRMVAAQDGGHTFTGFNEGLVGAWENYKVRLRDHALSILDAPRWLERDIGSGLILKHTIDAIEIQDSRANLTNNLVTWQNRWGHANRDHRVLLEAVTDPKLRATLERLLFGLYHGNADEAATFDALSVTTGAKYPLLAYIFFLKDPGRFAPIRPTTFDAAFREMGIPLVTLSRCGWENYARYNAVLADVRDALADALKPINVRLIDAHSFCWMLVKLDQGVASSVNTNQRNGSGRILSARDVAIVRMRISVENTVSGANGQIIQQTIKNKELIGMTSGQLEQRIRAMLDLQQDRCALTGIPFEFTETTADKNLLPSVDRIDSNGQYEDGNLQIVCRFVNFWKGAGDNEEFKRLLMLIRGAEEDLPTSSLQLAG